MPGAPETSIVTLSPRSTFSSSPPVSRQGGVSESPGTDLVSSEVDSGSPTLTLRSTASQGQSADVASPQLPTLPALRRFGATNLYSSPPAEHPTDSSVYYTASWGSPYQRPTPDKNRAGDRLPRRHRHSRTISSDSFLDSSSPLQLRDLGLSSDHSVRDPALRAAPLQDSTSKRASDLLPSPTLLRGGIQSTRSFADARVTHYLSGRSHSDRGTWWSDESAEGDLTSYTGRARRGLARDTSKDSLGLDEAQPSVSPWAITPRPALNSTQSFGPRRHKSKRSNETLMQEDFWRPRRIDPDSTSRSRSPRKIGPTSDSRSRSPRKIDSEAGAGARNVQASRFADTPSPVKGALAAAPTPETPTSVNEMVSPIPEESTLIPSPHERKASIQESPGRSQHERRASIKESPAPSLHERKPSLQDSPTRSSHERKASIKESPGRSSHQRKPSIKESPAGSGPARPSHRRMPTMSSSKKRVLWRGKNCVIAIPTNDHRGREGSGPMPLRPDQVTDLLRQWQEQGFDTRGFGYWSDRAIVNGSEGEGQSRSVYPDPQDVANDRRDYSCTVSIPDRKEWEAYVNFLNEERLRALGVSSGDEDMASGFSPAPSAMSRQLSSQFTAPSFSPPPATSSVASNHAARHASPFSPPLLGIGSTDPSSRVASIGSPLSLNAGGAQNTMPSPNVGRDGNTSSPFQMLSQQPSPPLRGMWPTGQHQADGFVRGGSPAMLGNLQSLGEVLSPSPAAGDENDELRGQDQKKPPPDSQPTEGAVKGQGYAFAFQGNSQPAETKVDSGRPPTDASVSFQPLSGHHDQSTAFIDPHNDINVKPYGGSSPQHHDEEPISNPTSPFDTGDMPIDQGSLSDLLGYNPSPTPQPEHAQSAVEKAQQSQEPAHTPTLHHPQPHAKNHSLSQYRLERTLDPFTNDDGLFSESRNFQQESDMNLTHDQRAERSGVSSADVETNPRRRGSPDFGSQANRGKHSHQTSAASNPWSGVDQVSNAGSNAGSRQAGPHTAKSSRSKLNVAAKEFRFDPGSSFTPGNFSFSSNSFQPSNLSSNCFNDKPAAHQRHVSGISGASSRGLPGGLNVAAAEFEPSKPAKTSFPTGDFSFSSAGPTFRPNAPAFTPRQPEEPRALGDNVSVTQPAAERSSGDKDKIFNMSGITKTAKPSRAIPIIRPDDNVRQSSSEEKEEEEAQEDESGRITQGDGRLKRARRVESRTINQIRGLPLSTPPAESKQNQMPSAGSLGGKSPSPGKENALTESSGNTIKSGSGQPERPTQVAESLKATKTQDQAGSSWAPFEFTRSNDAKVFNDARPSSLPKQVGKRPIQSAPRTEEDSDEIMDELSAQQAELAIDANQTGSVSRSPEAIDGGREPSSIRAENQELDASGFQSDFNVQPKIAPSAGNAKGTLRDSIFAQSDSSDHDPIDTNAAKQDQLAEHVDAGSGSPKEGKKALQVSPPSGLIQTGVASSPGKTLGTALQKNGPSWSPDQLPPYSAAQDVSSPIHQVRPDLKLRSDAPSPSPRRMPRAYQRLPYEIPQLDATSSAHGSSEPERAGIAYDSPVHRLNSAGGRPISDWDDLLSSSDEHKFQARSRFFDHHIDKLVGGVLEERLGPLEQAMKTIETSIAAIATDRAPSRKRYRSVSAEIVNSDADDEEEDLSSQHRPKSPRKDLRFDRMRSVILEAMASQQSDRSHSPPAHLVNIQSALADLRSSLAQQSPPQPQNDDLKRMLEETLEQGFSRQQKALPSMSEAEVDELRSRNVSLEQMLQKANSRVDQEIESRRAAEGRAFESEKELGSFRDKDDRQKGLDDEKDQRLQAFDNDMQQDLIQAQMQTSFLEGVRENLQNTSAELSSKNVELESSLMEAGMKENKHREEIERLTHESKELRRTLDSMRTQMEESIRVREGLRGKFDHLQADMAVASRNMAREQQVWRKRDEDHSVGHEVTKARLEAEARTRERLERELGRLEEQEREAMKLRVQVEQTQNANAKLENLLNAVRLESFESQQRAARFEHEFNEAREAGRAEVQRARILFDADIEAANNQVNVVRADLESKIGRVRSDFEHLKSEADNAKAQAELDLEKAFASKMEALREAAEDRERAMKEQSSQSERHMEDTNFQHDRAVSNALEDKQRSESHMLERLSLSDSKVEYFQDKVGHLEERLEITKSAAHAAARAAKSAQVAPLPAAAASLAKGAEIPEKISPQALRESILVLQEQLQEREGRIENLESELGTIDRDAPTKIKAQDSEIGWLRELLGVRIGDLQDIITTLSQPEYDREAAKDAAIRLKANLDMEQQEKERAIKGGQGFPSLASISSFASPRAALPLAAAWGNWRKGKEGAQNAFADFTSNRNQTPSKSSPSAQSFLSGLLTPPSTNLRQTPQGSEVPPSRTKSVSRMDNRPRPQSSSKPSQRRAEKQPMHRPPTTPPLLRHASYDQDAENGDYSTHGFYDDDESTVDGSVVNKGPDPEEPFGPGIKM